jgi:hypothetical protein
LIYVLVNKEPYPFARNLLIFVAAAEILALFLESACRHIDEAEDKLLRKEVDEAKRGIEALTNKQAPRHLTDATKEDWVASLSQYRDQIFSVHQIGRGDAEAATFAEEIHAVLQKCGWRGSVRTHLKPRNDFSISSGVGIVLGMDTRFQTVPDGKQKDAAIALREQMKNCHIQATEHADLNLIWLAPTEIGIMVGPKPS